MKCAHIYVDGRAYQGEDLDHEEPRRPGLGTLHNFSTLDALKFGDVPKDIHGEIGIRGAIERILTRLRSGTLDAKRIVIEIEEVRP